MNIKQRLLDLEKELPEGSAGTQRIIDISGCVAERLEGNVTAEEFVDAVERTFASIRQDETGAYSFGFAPKIAYALGLEEFAQEVRKAYQNRIHKE